MGFVVALSERFLQFVRVNIRGALGSNPDSWKPGRAMTIIQRLSFQILSRNKMPLAFCVRGIRFLIALNLGG